MSDTGKTIALIKALAPAPEIDPEQVKQDVEDWLDDHPEATTTVQDGSITRVKLAAELKNDLSDMNVSVESTDDTLYEFLGEIKKQNITVPKGSTRRALLKVDVKNGEKITFSAKLVSALSVNTYFYLKTPAGTDLFPGTSRGLVSGSTLLEYTFTPSGDYENCTFQFTISNNATTDAEFEYVKARHDIGGKYSDDQETVYEKIADVAGSIGENTYHSQSVTGIVSNVDVHVAKGTTKGKLLHCDLNKGNMITVSGKLKSALSVNSYLYLQDASGNELLPGTSVVIPSGTTAFSFTYNPVQDLTGCWLKYTLANSAASDADFEYVTIRKKAQTQTKLHVAAHNSTLDSETIIQNEYAYPVFYKAEEIAFKTSGAAYSGAQIVLRENIAIGQTIKVTGTRGENGNSWTMRIDFRDIENQRIGQENTTQGNEVEAIIPEGTNWIEVTLAGCWGTALDENTEITFSDVNVYYSAIESAQGGNGNSIYTGERVTLNDTSSQKNRCNISLWKNFLGTEISDLADYVLDKNQSMAIFDGYVFMLQENGTALILDYTDKTIVSAAEVGPTSGQHHNSAQFTDLYYDQDDEFPLLLTSRCGNSNQGQSAGDECQVYRVTRSGTAFTFTLVNRIFADVVTKGSSWGIDNVTRQLYMIGAQTAWWETGTHLPLVMAIWDMPTLEQIKSGTDITLSIDDSIAHANMPDVTIQGMAVNGGLAFIGISHDGQHVYVIDVFANKIRSKIPLTSTKEVEGVAVYENKLYVSQKNGGDTTGTNPCEIYQIEFS